MDQRRVSREQSRKQHHVREDEQPEAVWDDDALGLGPAVAEASVLGTAVGQADGGGFGGHVDWLRCWRCSCRIRRRSRALAMTSSTGMMCSCSSRHAYQTSTAKAPMRPRSASHQMYQMIATPQTAAKMAT